MKLKLSEYNIRNLQEELETYQDSLLQASYDIVNNLVSIGYDKANELNDIAPQSSNEKSVVNKNETTAEVDGTYSGYVSLEGKSAIYDEFGTGEYGQSMPHPMKGNFDLNPYNSGPYVSTHINKYGRHYWFIPEGSFTSGINSYTKPSGYTEGIPAGKQMYNTAKYIRKVASKVVKTEVNKATTTLRASLKDK